MATAKGKQQRKGRAAGEAARAEGGDAPRTVSWRGMEVELPASDRLGGVLFDLLDLQEQGEVVANLALVRAAVGEGQFAAIRARVREDGLSMREAADAVADLAERVLAAYGMTEGE